MFFKRTLWYIEGMQWAVYEPMSVSQPSGLPGMVELPSQQVVQQPNVQERTQPQNQVRKIQAPDIPYTPPSQENNVKVPEPKKRKSDLADISEYDEPTDLAYIAVASLIGVVGLLIVTRAFPEVFGKNLNLLFNRFKLLSLVAYVLMMTVVIGIARYIYSEFIFLQHDWNPLYFTGITALTQMLHDLLMYYGVVNTMERGNNTIVDLLKDYTESGGSRILFGNALLTVIVSIVSMLLKGAPVHMVAALGGVAAYMIPFALEAKNEFSNIS
jgi:hypothetical protein